MIAQVSAIIPESTSVCICCGDLGARVLQDGRPVGKLFRGVRSSLLRCPGCDHLYLHPLPDDDLLTLFYQEVYRHHCSVDEDYDQEFWYQKSHIEVVQAAADRFLGKTSAYRLHDLACGYGGLVHLLAQQGVNSSGNDFGEDMILRARERGNTRIFEGTFEQYLATRPEPFDMVTAFHCLEHFKDPRDELRRIRGRLSTAGVCLIRVPNGQYYPSERLSFHSNDWVSFPMHLQYFTPRSISAILEQVGLKALSVRCTDWETDRELLFASLGLDEHRLAAPQALLEALRRNLLLRELDVVCCRDDAAEVAEFERSAFRNPNVALDCANRPIVQIADFSHRQGDFGLSYAFGREPFQADGLMETAILDGYQVWKGRHPHCLIGRNFISPDQDIPLIQWRAPHSGYVKVRVQMAPMHAQCEGMQLMLGRDGQMVAQRDDIRPGSPTSTEVLIKVNGDTLLTIAFPPLHSSAFCFTLLGLAFDFVDVVT